MQTSSAFSIKQKWRNPFFRAKWWKRLKVACTNSCTVLSFLLFLDFFICRQMSRDSQLTEVWFPFLHSAKPKNNCFVFALWKSFLQWRIFLIPFLRNSKQCTCVVDLEWFSFYISLVFCLFRNLLICGDGVLIDRLMNFQKILDLFRNSLSIDTCAVKRYPSQFTISLFPLDQKTLQTLFHWPLRSRTQRCPLSKRPTIPNRSSPVPSFPPSLLPRSHRLWKPCDKLDCAGRRQPGEFREFGNIRPGQAADGAVRCGSGAVRPDQASWRPLQSRWRRSRGGGQRSESGALKNDAMRVSPPRWPSQKEKEEK